jgi:hypothetical protein
LFVENPDLVGVLHKQLDRVFLGQDLKLM